MVSEKVIESPELVNMVHDLVRNASKDALYKQIEKLVEDQFTRYVRHSLLSTITKRLESDNFGDDLDKMIQAKLQARTDAAIDRCLAAVQEEVKKRSVAEADTHVRAHFNEVAADRMDTLITDMVEPHIDGAVERHVKKITSERLEPLVREYTAHASLVFKNRLRDDASEVFQESISRAFTAFVPSYYLQRASHDAHHCVTGLLHLQ